MFTGHAGKLVTMEQTIEGFQEILTGKYDHLPEVAFYMVGDISEVNIKFEAAGFPQNFQFEITCQQINLLILFYDTYLIFQVVQKAERLAAETS